MDLTLKIEAATLAVLARIAGFTRVTEDEKHARVIQDALRIYEWILSEQAHGRTIVALESGDLELLSTSDATEGQRFMLPPFIHTEDLPAARAYFDRARDPGADQFGSAVS